MPVTVSIEIANFQTDVFQKTATPSSTSSQIDTGYSAGSPRLSKCLRAQALGCALLLLDVIIFLHQQFLSQLFNPFKTMVKYSYTALTVAFAVCAAEPAHSDGKSFVVNVLA